MDLATALVQEGVLSADDVARALASARDGDVASAALRLGLADEGRLVRGVARAWECPGIDLSRSRLLRQGAVGGSGVVETTAAVPAGLSGATLYFQGLVSIPGAGSLSRTAELVAP